MEENKPHLDDSSAPRVKFEERDVNAWAVTKFGIALSLTVIAALFVLWGLFSYFQGREQAAQPVPPSVGVNVDARKLPPEPRLQSAPRLDLKEMREAEDQILNGYAWIDPEKGVVRIPIDRAMDIVVQKGLQSQATPGPQTADNVSVPSESGLGISVPLLPDQPEQIIGTGDFAAGRQAGGPPTPQPQTGEAPLGPGQGRGGEMSVPPPSEGVAGGRPKQQGATSPGEPVSPSSGSTPGGGNVNAPQGARTGGQPGAGAGATAQKSSKASEASKK